MMGLNIEYIDSWLHGVTHQAVITLSLVTVGLQIIYRFSCNTDIALVTFNK